MPEAKDSGKKPASKAATPKPAAKPAAKPAPKSAAKSAAKPTAKPTPKSTTAKAVAKPTPTKPATPKPSAKVATKPAQVLPEPMPAPAEAPPTTTPTTTSAIAPKPAAPRRPIRKYLRASALVLLGVFVGFSATFAIATAQKATSQQEPLLMAASEVARDWGLDDMVAVAEDIYYGYLNPPKVGGTPAGPASFDGSTEDPTTPTPEPVPVVTPDANIPAFGPAGEPLPVPQKLVSPVTPLPGEGTWRRTKIVVNGSTAIYVARVRPDTSHTSVYATIAWFDTNLLGFSQVPGTKLPEGKFKHGDGRVPAELKKFYVAGLASGYKMNQSQGGYVKDGLVVSRLVRGKATLLTYPDGSIDIVKWGREPYKPGYSIARQNLNPMVYKGVSQVDSNSAAQWGSPWHGTGSGGNYVWRSGIGKTANGSIVYVQSEALTAKTLANLLVQAGAVEGMALDMNSGFANGNLFGPYLPKGKHINPDNPNPSRNFYDASERDFIAVFAKSPEKPKG